MVIMPYKAGSESAKSLAQALGIKRIKQEGSKFKGAAHKVVINWGNSRLSEEILKCHVLNAPVAVSKASNKLSFFKAMAEAGVTVPRFTEDPVEAMVWLLEDSTIVVRHILNGHSGAGIELVKMEGLALPALPKAPLYVEYVPKKEEYRVHVFQGEVVDVQRKARKKDVPDEEVNWQIRNHANGFIFARGEEMGVVPEDVTKQAIDAVNAIGLDFGAADVIWNDKQKKAYVLEVNTAPGLTGATLDGYVERFKAFV